MTLSKALKYRKRIESAIKKLSRDIQTYNTITYYPTGSSREVPKPEVNVRELMSERDNLIEHLISINTLINKATCSIYEKLLRIREIKGHISMLSSLPHSHGQAYQYGNDSGTAYYYSEFRKNEIDEMIKGHEKTIDQLQDEVDAFNATTKIDIQDIM